MSLWLVSAVVIFKPWGVRDSMSVQPQNTKLQGLLVVTAALTYRDGNESFQCPLNTFKCLLSVYSRETWIIQLRELRPTNGEEIWHSKNYSKFLINKYFKTLKCFWTMSLLSLRDFRKVTFHHTYDQFMWLPDIFQKIDWLISVLFFLAAGVSPIHATHQ